MCLRNFQIRKKPGPAISERFSANEKRRPRAKRRDRRRAALKIRPADAIFVERGRRGQNGAGNYGK
jgi:hypothetical protein